MDSVQQFSIKGLVPAVFTPMTNDGELNLDKIPAYGKFLKDNGIKSIFVNGTTGEGPSLTIEERKQVTEAWMANTKHGLQHVVVHAGGANIKESQQLARHAAEVKVDAIGLMPPTFLKPGNVESLVEYCRQVACCAPNLPFYYYNIPMMTGVKFNMLQYIEQMEKAVPTFRGVKYSYWDMTEASLCYNYGNSKYNIIFGVDEQLLAALVFGIDAAIGSTYNFMTSISEKVIQAKNKGNMELARQEQMKAQKILNTAFKYVSCHGNLPVLKALMTMLTPIDVGPPRLPLYPLKEDQILAMRKDLISLGCCENLM